MSDIVREALAAFVGQRLGFEGVFDHYGTRLDDGGRIGTMCFFDVRTGDHLLDHAWVDVTRDLLLLNLKPGDVVCFTAIVEQYPKGMGVDCGLCDVQDVGR